MKLALSFTFLSTAAAFTRPAGTGMPFMVQKSGTIFSLNCLCVYIITWNEGHGCVVFHLGVCVSIDFRD